MVTLALVMTALMGGIVAYNGDLIGRRFGKKRVTLFGLRPRYTAILITSVTGIFISGITIGVLFLLVPPVRDVILKGEKALKDNVVLTNQNTGLRTQNAEQASLAEKARIERAAVERNLANVQQDEAEARQKLAETRSLLAKVEAQRQDAEARKIEAEGRARAADERYAKTEAKNKSLVQRNTKLADINVSLTHEISGLTAKKEELTQQNALLARRNSDYQEANEDLARRNGDLTRQNDKLEKEKAGYEKQIATLTRQSSTERDTLLDLKHSNDLLEAKNKQLAGTNARLTSENSELQDIVKRMAPGYKSVMDAYWAARSKRVAVHKDQDLARIVIPAGTDPSGVRTFLQTLMREASDAAISRGASTGEGLRAVQVVDWQFQEQSTSGQVRTVQMSGDERVDAVVRKLAWQTGPCAVLAIAVTNTVEQEPAAIDLLPYANHLVFPKGRVVMGRYFNATQPTPGIFDDMVKFLKEMGRYAVGEGVIPRLDPLTGEPEVGAMNAKEIVDIVERIRGVGGRVRVRAIAQQDIYSADPLNVKFEVMP